MREQGIDISWWQGIWTWLQNIFFVIIKATDGMGIDGHYYDNLAEVKKVPVRGAYHYFRTAADPVAQARFFWQAVQDHRFHFLAVDYEGRHNVLDKVGALNLYLFLQELGDLTQLPVVLYTTEYILRDNLIVHYGDFNKIPLWVARHNSSMDPQEDEPLQLDTGAQWVLWQYSAKGNKKGGEFGAESEDICLDVDNGKFIRRLIMKKAYNSKTIIFNLLAVIILWILPAIWPDFVLAIPESWAPFEAPVLAIVNLILRLVTNKGIEL